MQAHIHRHKPLPPRRHFVLRLGRNILIGAGLVLFSLGLGMVGYHGLAGLSWLDAFLNASMILTGMGPVNEMHSDAAKLFAGCYAIFSGVVFLTMAALVIAPILHRFLHRMHLDIETDEDEETKEARG